MAHFSVGKARVAAALASIALAVGIVAACGDHHGDVYYDNCPDWQCGDGLFLVPFIVPAYGVYGTPGYHPAVTIQPGAPNYRPTYYGKPPNFTPPSGAKVNPPGQKPPPNYKPPTGSTLTVQKAPKQSGNQMPSGSSSGGSGGKQTVQKSAPPKNSTSGGNRTSFGGGSRSSSTGGKR